MPLLPVRHWQPPLTYSSPPPSHQRSRLDRLRRVPQHLEQAPRTMHESSLLPRRDLAPEYEHPWARRPFLPLGSHGSHQHHLPRGAAQRRPDRSAIAYPWPAEAQQQRQSQVAEHLLIRKPEEVRAHHMTAERMAGAARQLRARPCPPRPLALYKLGPVRWRG